MTRPRNGCGRTPVFAGDAEQRHLWSVSVHGFSGTSVAHGRLVVPMSIQPLAVSMPVMCMPWHVAQVRLIGLPRPTELRCIESLIQNVRNMYTSWPRAIDSRDALRAFSVSSFVRGRCVHFPPSGKTQRVVLLPSTPASSAARLRGPNAGGPSGSTRLAGVAARHLRDVHLPLEFRDARNLGGAECACNLQVVPCRILGLQRQRGRARVGHQVHARRLPRLRIDRRRHAVLADERTDAEVLVRRVLRVGDRPRTPVHRHGGRCAVQPVAGIRVAAARIAHDFNRELGIETRAVGTLRRPWQRDAEQAAVEQLRVRTGIAGRQGGTVHAVDGGKQRILAAGGGPSLTNAVAPTATCRRTAGDT